MAVFRYLTMWALVLGLGGTAAHAVQATGDPANPRTSNSDSEAQGAEASEAADDAANREKPILYGGDRADPSAADMALRRASGLEGIGDARWFLEGFSPLTGSFYLLNSGPVTPCFEEGVSVDEIRSLVEKGKTLWFDFEVEAALEMYEEAMFLLGCANAVVPNKLLVDLFFGRAIALYYNDEANPDPARSAFSDAHRARPDLPWNPDYHYKPQQLFYEARDELQRRGKATLWTLVASVQVHVNGDLVQPEGGLEMLPGRNLLQITTNEGVFTALVTVTPGVKMLIGDTDSLWALSSAVDAGASLEQALATRRAIGTQVGTDYWLDADPNPLEVNAQTGALALDTTRERYKPKILAEIGVGYRWFDKSASLCEDCTLSPTPNWVVPQVALGLRVLPVLEIHVGGGLAFGGTYEAQPQGEPEPLTFLELLPHGFLGIGAARSRGVVRPGGRLDLWMYFLGNEFIDGNNDDIDDRDFDVFVGPRAAFTLDIVPTKVFGLQLELAAGWVGTFTVGTQLKFVLGRR
jgi:hypothetical protein